MVYDFKHNTVEFSQNGVEHYEKVLFYIVDNFSLRENDEFEVVDVG